MLHSDVRVRHTASSSPGPHRPLPTGNYLLLCIDTAGADNDVPTAGTDNDVPTAGTDNDVSTAGTDDDVSTAGTDNDVSTAGTDDDVSTAGTDDDVSTAGADDARRLILALAPADKRLVKHSNEIAHTCNYVNGQINPILCVN